MSCKPNLLKAESENKMVIKHPNAIYIFNQLVCWLREKGQNAKAGEIEACNKKKKYYLLAVEIIQCLESSNPWVRAAAAECLGSIGRKEAITPLCHALSDHFSEVRKAAAESLGILLTEKKHCPPALARKLQDPDELVRLHVAESLGSIGDKKSLPRLWKTIRDRSPLVRRYVVSAIGELGGKAELGRLQRELKNEKNDTTKLGYYTAIYNLGNKDILPALLALLKSKDYRVRCATANTLSEFTLNNSNASTILAELKRTLKGETTIAAKSALKECIGEIQKRFKKNA